MASPRNIINSEVQRPGAARVSPFAELDTGPNFPDAVCATIDPELWFPDSARQHGHGKGQSLERPARQLTANSRETRSVGLCQTCPHLDACADWALSTREEYGVWGGLTEQDRQDIWAQDGKAA